MLFIITQQEQPACIMLIMQSQQAWIILQPSASPLVQVSVQPLSVISQQVIPIIMLQQQAIMPFIIMAQLHIPPAIILHRLCSAAAAILSSQAHIIIMPPSHFSMRIVQLGTIIMFIPLMPDVVPGIVGIPMGGIDIPVRFIIIVSIILFLSTV